MKSIKIKDDIYWLGIVDHDLRIFDVILETEFGTSYNSYLIKGSEKNVLIDTAKAVFVDDYIKKIEEIISIKDIDAIVLNHAEPDHSGSIAKLLEINPNIKIYGSRNALSYLEHILNTDFNKHIVKENDFLDLGNKTLKFLDAKFLHWPDTMYTYLEEDKMLFTCDSFGTHYAIDEMFLSKVENMEDYLKSYKYYYDKILSPFKSYFLKAIDKVEQLDVDMILPGHGPILDKGFKEMVNLAKKYSTYQNPNNNLTVVIPYVTSYGYTEIMANEVKRGIESVGVDVELYNMVYEDTDKVLERIYHADGFLFGSPTILGDGLYPILELSIKLNPFIHGIKPAGVFGSYGWGGEGVKNLNERLIQLKMKVVEPIKLRFNPSESELKMCFDFGVNFANKIKEKR